MISLLASTSEIMLCDLKVNYGHVSVAINTNRLSIDSQIVIVSKTPSGVQIMYISDASTNERLSCTNSGGETNSSGRTNGCADVGV